MIKIDIEKYLKKVNIKRDDLNRIKKYLMENIEIILILSFLVLFPICAAVYSHIYSKNIKREIELMMKENEKDSYIGESFVTETYPILKDVVIIGDSYAHYVPYDLGFDFTVYSSPGLNLEQLSYAFDSASKSGKKNAVIFIGPNDYRYKTEIDEFETRLKDYAIMLKEKLGGSVVLCSYLPSEYSKILEKEKKIRHTIKEYDEGIRKVAKSDKKFYYLDLYDLADKKEYYRSNQDINDTIHFNRKFNIAFINKLSDLMVEIAKEELK